MDDFFERLESFLRGQDSSLERLLRVTLGTPAISLALLSSSSIKSHSFSLPECPVNEQTLFQACSISKPVAAAATFRAIQSGHLALHDPITKYLTADQASQISRDGCTAKLLQHVTFSHLLSHTSGLGQGGFPGYRYGPYPRASEIVSGVSPSNTPQVRLEDFPGREFSYSGGGYTVLQLTLENIFHKSLPEIVQELVFDPLEMRSSSYNIDSTKMVHNKMYFAPAYETGFLPATPQYHVLPEQAAAGVWTTPSDLLRLVRAVRSSVSGADEEFLQRDLALQMLEEVQSGMAHGWEAPKGANVFAHAGSNNPGYRCFVLGFVDRNQSESGARLARNADGIAIMTNSALGFSTIGKIVHAAAYLLEWDLDDVNEGFQIPVGMPLPIPDAPAPRGWSKWCGIWCEEKESASTEQASFLIPATGDYPTVSFGALPPVRLLSAAVGLKKTVKEPWYCLLAEGLDVLFVLSADDDKNPAVSLKTSMTEEGTKLVHKSH